MLQIAANMVGPQGVGSTTLGGSLANLWHAATVGESREPLVLVGRDKGLNL
jgi:hypothetical protein